MTGGAAKNAAREVVRRLLKREPQRTDADWADRTYPCRRRWCFRRSPAWRSFERYDKSWCDRHVPYQPSVDDEA